MAQHKSTVHPYIISESVQETSFTLQEGNVRRGHPSVNYYMPPAQIMQPPQQAMQSRSDKISSNNNFTQQQRRDNQESSFVPYTGHLQYGHPVIPMSSPNPPQAQIIYRTAEAPPELVKRKRRPEWVILTRICSAVFIILDNVSDWLQYFEMKNPLDAISVDLKAEVSKLNCTDISEISKKYMYFTIAGTVLGVIQLVNISYQIYLEVQFIRKKKTGQDSDEETNSKTGKLHKARKWLDGRTETFYSTVFIEIPQTLLLLKYQDGCLPGCNVNDFSADKKKLKKRIMALVNGFLGLLNNFWRYLTSEKACEEFIEDKKENGGCCSKCCGDCCTGCAESLFKCCCPCCCCFHRYECSTPCCLWGKTCICDKCQFSCDPLPCEVPFGCCTLYYCPLRDENNPKGPQDCIRGKQNCCESSDEPLIFHKSLAMIGNGIYFFLYVANVLSMFCMLLDTIVIKDIFYFILNTIVPIL